MADTEPHNEMQAINNNIEGDTRTDNMSTPPNDPPSSDDEENPSNDNEAELSQQKTTLNLNNRNVRLILWSMIYIVITTALINTSTVDQKNWDQDYVEDNNLLIEYKDAALTYLNWRISAFTILSSGATIFLCISLCSCCVCGRGMIGKIITSGLFIIGGLLQLVTLIKAFDVFCTNKYVPFGISKIKKGYCKVDGISNYLFIMIFSIYLGMDAFKSIGDNIKIRVFVVSFLLSIKAFLQFLYWNWRLNELKKDIEETINDPNSYYYNDNRESSHFFYGARTGSNFALFIFALIIIIFVIIYPILTKYRLILKIISTLILLTQAMSMWSYSKQAMSIEVITAVAVLLMVYDIQYLGHKNEDDAVVAADVDNDEHLDVELLKQLTVFNLNNRYIRWTFWCFIYIILSFKRLQLYIYDNLQYLEDKEDKFKEISNLGISAEVIFCFAAILVLIQLYTSRNTPWPLIKIAAFLFFVAAVLKLTFLIIGTEDSCNNYRFDQEDGYCEVYIIASDTLFEIIFLLYFALDLVKFIGDKITIRVMIVSVLASNESFLWFLYFNYTLNQYEDSQLYESEKYALRTLTGSNFILFFLCFVMIIIAGWKLKSQHNGAKMNSVLMKIIGILMLTSLGASIIGLRLSDDIRLVSYGSTYYFYYYDRWLRHYSRWDELIVPAVISLVYDIQYL